MIPAQYPAIHCAILLSLGTVCGGWVPASSQATAPGPTVEYLGNEGVLITHEQKAIVIDALFGNGLPEYPTVPGPVRDSLERALGRFGSIDLVLVTHRHDDHFNPAAVARHLRANARARLVAAPEVVALVNRAGWLEPERTTTIVPNPSRPGRWTSDGVGSSRVDLQACKLEYSIVSPK